MSQPLTIRQMIDTLIGFDTVSRHSNRNLIDWVANYLADQGITAHLVTNHDGSKANLYASVGPSVAGGVVLSGHTDVVPIDGQPWDSDPFQVVERDGKLFGRGTCDMKSFIAIGLGLVPEMKQLKKPIHFALTYDEEVGCLGAPDLITEITQRLPRPEAVIVGEPTLMKVVTAHKGIALMRTTVTGHEAHSSQVHRGVSAVMTGARLVHYLEQMAQEQAETNTNPEFEPSYTTIHVGTINGGTAANIISRRCEFVWDIRHIPSTDPQSIIEQFNAYCAEQLPAMKKIAPTSDIVTEVQVTAPAFEHRADSPAVELAKALTGQNNTAKVPYVTEAGQYQRASLATVVCGPGSIDQAHQPNEFISLAQVEEGTQFVRRLIERLSTPR